MKLSEGNLIRIEKGMRVYAEAFPKKFLSDEGCYYCFIDETWSYGIKVGEIYHKRIPDKEELVAGITQAVKWRLNYKGEIRENVANFLDGLNLNFEPEEYDTSIYEGIYRVYRIKYCKSDHPFAGNPFWRVDAEKVDNPELKIAFYQENTIYDIEVEIVDNK